MGVTNILMMKKAWAEWAPGVWTLGGQGNSLAVSTGEGIVLVDAGPGGEITARMIACLRECTDLPLSHIVYSHGHMGYNNGVRDWLIDAYERGHPAPLVVALRHTGTVCPTSHIKMNCSLAVPCARFS